MGKVIVANYVTLDGVMQATGCPDGDTRDGTYERPLASWNERGGPFKDPLDDTQKFVASHDAATTLEWPNSTLMTGSSRPCEMSARSDERPATSASTSPTGASRRAVGPTGCYLETASRTSPRSSARA